MSKKDTLVIWKCAGQYDLVIEAKGLIIDSYKTRHDAEMALNAISRFIERTAPKPKPKAEVHEPCGNGVSGHWFLTKEQFENQRL